MIVSSVVSSISNILLFWSFAVTELVYEHACPQKYVVPTLHFSLCPRTLCRICKKMYFVLD